MRSRRPRLVWAYQLLSKNKALKFAAGLDYMPIFAIAFEEYEWRDVIYVKKDGVTKEQFVQEFREAIANAIREAVRQNPDSFVGFGELRKILVEELRKRGYEIIEPEYEIVLFSSTFHIFRCYEYKVNLKYVPEDVCRLVSEHNEKVEQQLEEEIKMKNKT